MGEVEPHIGPEYAKRPSLREVEILVLVARGMTNAEVAEALVVSEATIKRHLANLYLKLGIRSRSAAVNASLHTGLLSSEEVWGTNGVTPRYFCQTSGCNCEVVMVRPPSEQPAWRPPVCHGTEMARVS